MATLSALVPRMVERRRGLSGPSIGESAPDAPDATAASDLATRRAALMNPSATKMTIEWARQHQERLGDPLYDRAVIASHHARISEFVPPLAPA